MPLAPLAIVFALVAIDYGVWNWALSANHEIVALVAGLAMAPLAIALAWLIAVAVGSGALVLARRAGREIAQRILGARPARSLRLADARNVAVEAPDAESAPDRVAA